MNNKIERIKNKGEENKFVINKNLIQVVKGSIISIILSLIFLFVYAIILTYTNISENTIVPTIIVISAISILIGSSISSIKIKKQGMINGALVGTIYILFIYILSSTFLTGFQFSINTIIMIISGILAGILGGIIGVNLS